MVFLQEHATTILAKLHDKGWNPYQKKGRVADDSEGVIRVGPAERLQPEGRYVLLPRVENSRDPTTVYAALETLAVRLDRETPTITIGRDNPQPFTGFTLNQTSVKPHTPEGPHISYGMFIDALGTIVQV